MKKLLAFIIALVMCLSVTVSANGEEDSMKNKEQYGLHVEEDGTITLMGEEFHGFGLNYFGAFVRSSDNMEGAVDAYKAAFKSIAEHNIPFVRLPLSGYYAYYYDNYEADKDAMIAKMRDVLDTAAENKVGVVVSLMWWDFAMAAYLGVKRSDMGTEDSELVNYAKEYTSDIVSAFADHPAVWGWEIGNEYNLNADLCDPEFKNFLLDGYTGGAVENPTGFDYYTSEELVYFYSEVAKTIRQYDSYRMISTGNGEMRPFANAIYESSQAMNKKTHMWEMKWDGNTYKQFIEMNAYFTPEPIDTMCFHLQHGTWDSEPSYVLEHYLWGKTVSSKEYFEGYVAAAKAAGKGLFFGEFGDFLGMESAPDVAEKFYEVAHYISDAGIQIAALWQFQDYSDAGVAAEKLDVLTTLNTELQNAGKQNTEKAWKYQDPEETESAEESTETTESESTAQETNAPDKDEKGLPTGVVIAIAALAVCIVGAAVAFIVKKKK